MSNRGLEADYAKHIQSLIAGYRHYPRRARLQGQQGTARVLFTLDREGKVVHSRIEQSSGHDLLDREVLAMIERAQPLPPIPDRVGRSRLELILPVEFELK